jgi:uncharacterized membrane protein YkoI
MKMIAMSLLAAGSVLVGCNKSVESASQDFNQLPPAVQKTVRAQAPNAEIASISKTTTNGMDAYKVEIRGEGRNPVVVVGANGTLLSSELGGQAGMIERALTPTGAVGTPYSALPAAVQKTIQSQAPNAQIAGISRHEDNGRVIYEVEFKDQGKNPTIKVADDGTLVQTLQK